MRMQKANYRTVYRVIVNGLMQEEYESKSLAERDVKQAQAQGKDAYVYTASVVEY